MNDSNLPSESNGDDANAPEVRLELTQAGVRQVLSLYAEEAAGRAAHGGMEIGFAEIIEAMLARKQLLIACLIAGVLFGLLVVFIATPLYTVSTQVVLDQQGSLDTTLESGRGGSAFIATQAEIMQSRSVVADAVAGLTPPADQEDPVAAALEALQASPVSGTQVVALSYLGPDPLYGEALLRATVDAHQNRLTVDEQASQQQRLSAKQAEYDALIAEVERLEDELRELRRTHFNGLSAEDSLEARSQIIRDQNEQLLEVKRQRLALENQLQAGSIDVLGADSATRALQDRLFQAETDLARLTQTLQPSHPSRVAAEREVRLLRAQLDNTSQASPQALEREIAAARGVEQALLLGLEQSNAELADFERLRRAETRVIDELEQTRGLMEIRRRALLDQRLFAHLAGAGEVGVTARIIEEPVQPFAPTWPNSPLVLAICGAIGLLIGIFWAVFSFRARQMDWMSGDQMPHSGVGRP